MGDDAMHSKAEMRMSERRTIQRDRRGETSFYTPNVFCWRQPNRESCEDFFRGAWLPGSALVLLYTTLSATSWNTLPRCNV